MKRIIRILVLLLFVAMVAWVFIYLYKQSKGDPVTHELESPFIGNIIKKAVATGSVIPRQEIAIKPQESGIISEIFVNAGDRVNRGDMIARIQIIPEMTEINAAENRLNKARLEFNNAQAEFDRKSRLYEQRVIARVEFEAEELRFNMRQEDLMAAENHLQLIREGVTKKMGGQTNTLIRSTIDGMVLDVPVKVGNSVIRSNAFNDGTTIALVADMSDMIFEGMVDETEVGNIAEGMHLMLTIGAMPQNSFDAYLEFISPKGVEDNGAIQFEIRAAVRQKEDLFIRAGYSANADIVLDRRDSVMVINEKVLQFNGDTVFVEVQVTPGQFEKRNIKTSLSDGINIEVIEGLSLTDEVKVPVI